MWFPLSPIIVAAALTAPAHRQLTAERRFADSLFDRIEDARTPAALPHAVCTNRTPELTRLCEGLLLERQSELTRNANDARAAEFAMERAVLDLPRSATAWYGLGLVRLQLAHDTLFSRGGALMPIGISYLTGAANAFAESVRRDMTFTRALVALATTPLGREDAYALKDRIAVFRKVRSILPPEILPLVAALERDAGSVDSAVALEQRALASGKVDAGVVSVGLARDLYRTGHPREGRSVLLAGAGTPSSASDRAYRTELAWVASPAELASWDSLAPAQRSAWLGDFWQKRDIAEGRKDGARLIEHYQRIEYALKNFRVTVPQTGRPTFLSYTPTVVGLLANADCDPTVALYANLDQSIGAHPLHRDYTPIQDQIDDRGVIWIRHGPPTKRALSLALEASEVWHYDLSPTPLVLQFHEVDFDGSTEASVLVSTLVTASPATRVQLCPVEFSLCVPGDDILADSERQHPGSTLAGHCRNAAGSLAAIANMSPEIVVQDHKLGEAAITRGTTTDSYQRDFSHAVTPALQIYGLDRASGDSPRIVVAYALPADQLVATRVARGVTYPVSLQLMAADSAGRRIDIDTLHTFHAPALLIKGQYITGLIELPIPAGTYHVSVVATQTDGRGAIAHIDQVVVPGATAQLAVSDLVLGSLTSGVQWNSGTSMVALNPLDTYPAGGSAEVYFQLDHLVAAHPYTARFDIYRGNDDTNQQPIIALSSTVNATRARMEISRTLGLQNLEPGRYRIRLTVTGDNASATSTGWITIIK